MKTILLTCAFVALASVASAQTHPCDLAPPTGTVQIAGNKFTDGFCHDLRDVNGDPLTLGRIFNLYVDGTKVWSGALSAIGSISSTGYYYFEVPQQTGSFGIHTATVSVTDSAQESDLSNVITFELKPGKAKPPKNQVIKR
jgi:hypothetical protein